MQHSAALKNTEINATNDTFIGGNNMTEEKFINAVGKAKRDTSGFVQD